MQCLRLAAAAGWLAVFAADPTAKAATELRWAVNVTVNPPSTSTAVPYTGDTQSGFTTTVTSGTWVKDASPPPAAYDGLTISTATGSLRITEAGTPFTFQRLQLSSLSGTPLTYSFTGLLAGQTVYSTTTTTAPSGLFINPVNPNATAAIDTLQISLATSVPQQFGAGLDNIILGTPGSAVGDPHFTTFAGAHYDYQGRGDFVLVRSLLTGSQFDVQIHTRSPSDNTSVTIISAAAAALCGHRVSFDIDRASGGGSFVQVDGAGVSLTVGGAALAFGGCSLLETSLDHFRAIWNTGELVDIANLGWYLDVTVTPTLFDLDGPLEGLLTSALDPGRWVVSSGASLFAVPAPPGIGLLGVALAGLVLLRVSGRRARAVRAA